MRAILTILANAVALLIISRLLSGFVFEGGYLAPILVAAILSILNFILKPVIKLLSFPLIFITGGLFLIVINAFLIYLSSYLLRVMDISGTALHVESILTYVFAAIILGVANWLIHWFLKDN
ncbi:MAG: phage holin family protein [Candidatus Gracilibacteria bacterium]|jgi:putative membrane protein